MKDKDLHKRLSETGAKLAKTKGAVKTEKQEHDDENRRMNMAYGIRLSIDFLAAIAVAGFLGWWLDGALETRPWIMVVMIPLGFAAGIVNMMRTAKRYDNET